MFGRRCVDCLEVVIPTTYRPGWKHVATHRMKYYTAYGTQEDYEVSAYNLDVTLASPMYKEACACDDEPLANEAIYVPTVPVLSR